MSPCRKHDLHPNPVPGRFADSTSSAPENTDTTTTLAAADDGPQNRVAEVIEFPSTAAAATPLPTRLSLIEAPLGDLRRVTMRASHPLRATAVFAPIQSTSDRRSTARA